MAFGNGKKLKAEAVPSIANLPVPTEIHDLYGKRPDDYSDYSPQPKVDMEALEGEIVADRLKQIAKLMQELRYGEMIQLADEIRKVDPESKIIKPDHTFAGILHKWSAGRSS